MQKLPALEEGNSPEKGGDAMRGIPKNEWMPCAHELELDYRTFFVEYVGGYIETYVNDFHFVVDEVKSIFLVRKGKKRELKLTNDFERKIICELERLAN